ncbi:hypothetical protein SAMD00019534_081330 [Acytostelium subglobosum LB1]|uniref:hypothetical protein n=1 Tax=Acytostelium subglobosum LB1 TaxID=1410327 RepID=UPI00064515AA|nr:hypothetical protein SAMD00019534_081330 [Acytostelium subglobosum LB1]GAM24958.1 hypothetical protein SAMD00019534_081330 [Acytostelium subglobosum LB1]|eukprot:XP_012752047.1 hypothetical protein SAMD00019534_081330 [Acytostelium subglobosum LB1]
MFKFITDSNGYPDKLDADQLRWTPQCLVVVVEAFNTGITPGHVVNDKDRLISFNIIMDTEQYGVPPEIPMLVIIIVISVVMIAIIFKFLFPKIKGLQLLV